MTTSSENTAAMEIDRDTSPSIKSEAIFSSTNSDSTGPSEPPSPTKSIKSQTPYIDTFDLLPSTGYEKQAHIIDIDAFAECTEQKGTLQMLHAVATVLYLASPETLKSFLSPTVHAFKAIFKGGRGDAQLVVWRKGIEVFVSANLHYSPFQMLTLPDWHVHTPYHDEVVRLRACRWSAHRV